MGVPGDGGGGGHPVVVLFFASWCTSCRAELPALAAAYRHQRTSRSRLAKVPPVGVDGKEPAADALAFVRASVVTFPVGEDHSFAVTGGTSSFAAPPAAVTVTGDGTIAAIRYGVLSTSDLVRWQRHLLASGQRPTVDGRRVATPSER